MTHLLGLESVGLEFPSRSILSSVTIGVDEGSRIGVVGRNGDGKTSLLGLLAGTVEPTAGKVTRRRNLSIGHLSQGDDLDDDSTVGHSIVGDVEDYVWASNPTIRDIVDGLTGDIEWHTRIATLSGGQRRRVSLAAVLVGDYDLLLLDEPTNHLDIEGVDWLARHLNRRTTALLVVTHDRWFLDEVSTNTWEVHDGVVEAFIGGYAAYTLQRVERDRMAGATEAKRQNLARKELAWLRRGPPARTRKPKFRIDAAEQLIADVPPVRNDVELQKMAMQRLGRDVVDLLDVSVAYDHPVLRDVTWRIAPGERAGILGRNGAGKSTLLSLVRGSLSPDSGEVRRGKTVKIASLDQHGNELGSMSHERVREVVARKRTTYRIDGKDFTAAQLLERLGFRNADLQTPVGELSGGQRRRLQLLLILLDEPNVLILDEPTNDLDTDMLIAMEDLLDSWAGTLIVVSHDRYLLERVTDQQYMVADGRLRHLPSGVEEYLRSIRHRRDTARPEVQKPGGTTRSDNIERQSLQKEFASIERKLAKLPAQIEQVQARINGHDPLDHAGLTRHGEALVELHDRQSELEHRWLEISELFE